MRLNNTLKLIVALIVPQLAGFIGSLFTAPAIPVWYAGLVKPDFAPPNWVFAPVWTGLFILMGIAAFLVWSPYAKAPKDKKKGIKIALGIFVGQLGLNTLWSIIFFGLHSPSSAFIEIIFLWLAILVTIVAFSRISKLAAWLLVPYVAWVSFAAYLNYLIWLLN